MRILYIFPHPDDEAFGPAPAIDAQVKRGMEVFLQTWTKGGATKERHKLGLSVEEMGLIREQELLNSGKTIGLAGQEVLDLPDGGLKEMDPRVIEAETRRYIEEVKPHIVVTYPVHGISGFHDHLVCHAVVKRVYLEMKEAGASYLKRLAFLTISEGNGDVETRNKRHKLHKSTDAEIDCVYQLSEGNRQTFRASLDCYETYKDVIEETGVFEIIGDSVPFEIFGENFDTPLACLAEKLPG